MNDDHVWWISPRMGAVSDGAGVLPAPFHRRDMPFTKLDFRQYFIAEYILPRPSIPSSMSVKVYEIVGYVRVEELVRARLRLARDFEGPSAMDSTPSDWVQLLENFYRLDYWNQQLSRYISNAETRVFFKPPTSVQGFIDREPYSALSIPTHSVSVGARAVIEAFQGALADVLPLGTVDRAQVASRFVDRLRLELPPF